MNWFTIAFFDGSYATAFGATIEIAVATIGRQMSEVRRWMVDRHPREFFATLAQAKAGAS